MHRLCPISAGTSLALWRALLATVVALPASSVPVARSLPRSRVLPATVLFAAAVAPFELALPGSIAGFTLTTTEAAIVAAVCAAAMTWMHDRTALSIRTPIIMPLLALLAVSVMAALAAPELRGESIKVVARFAIAVALTLIVANVGRPDRHARHLAAAVLGAGAIVGIIAVLELTQLPWVLSALKTFRPGFHVVGGQLRATATMMYPTITSMFLEVAFALGLAWIGASWLAFGALILTAAGVIATFTRAGLITMAVSLVVYGAIVMLRRRSWTPEHSRLLLLGAAILALVLMSRSPQMLVARMSAEGSQEWYGASYSVPPRLTLQPNSFNDVRVAVTNEGRLTWQSTATPPFFLSYHWLLDGSEEVVSFDGLRTPFASPVAPGSRVTFDARVRAPQYPGTYVLVWDVVQEHRTWLSLEGVYPGKSTVVVEGTAVGLPPTFGRMPGNTLRMPRSVLWSTALRIAREHPMLGIGPDNFRHVYGRSLGLATWDERVHANNSYLEVLVGSGAIGVLALAWLIAAIARATPRLLRTTSAVRVPVMAAATAACVAIAVHGLVDSFLTFTPTYLAFAIAAGLMFPARESAPCA